MTLGYIYRIAFKGVTDTALTQKSAHRKDLNAGIGDMQHRHFATIIREMDRGLIVCSEGATRKFVAELFADRLCYTTQSPTSWRT